ncbi:High affinity cationic amino acid transporter 1 [Orchesella cincta]|uniref:High affinity cationic amino acid transporter 1 n=1 Tax=Orchesella cincta TaxID=48709 RepID=A0A1D2N4K7_ORCCI|nr:High affinity cationic amino acid transporter 1 [Orchesella cincta]
MGLMKKFTRKKLVDRDETSTELHRVLSTVDLTLLGIGSTLGVGIYVLAGEEAKKDAGPAVVISFLVAALASVLAGLCYAEFGARVPKAGSAYVYSYVCVGEFIAFVVGWNLIMEYVIGVASVAKGYSENVDKLFNNVMGDAFKHYFPIGHFGIFAESFDWFAFSVTLILTLILARGVKESSMFNNIFTCLNLGVVVFVVIAGSFFVDSKNWVLDKNETLKAYPNITAAAIGEGGFAPFGFHGIMKGAATCFYGFVGFDAIATTGEEAKNPQRSIPMAIIISLLFIFFAYFGISLVLTGMVPYFLQDENAPLPHAFMSAGFETGKWVVSIGAVFGLSTSLLGAMFPMPRVIYAMASDGVLFKFLSKVHPRFQTPLIATLIAGTFGGFMAALFNLDDLINMMSIGTLTAYTLVAVCVLCLRYRKDVDGADDLENMDLDKEYAMQRFWQRWLNMGSASVPTEMSSSYTDRAVTLYCFLSFVFSGIAIRFEDEIVDLQYPFIVSLCLAGVCLLGILVSLSMQPVSRAKLSFKVPLVPALPGISILVNIYLILKLSYETWIRFAVWMAIGFIFYAICLFNGTTDAAYQRSVEKRQRKYSKVSANGFRNAVFQLSEKSEETRNGNGSTTIQLRNISKTVNNEQLEGQSSSSQNPGQV